MAELIFVVGQLVNCVGSPDQFFPLCVHATALLSKLTCCCCLGGQDLDLGFEFGDSPLGILGDMGMGEVSAALVACLRQRIDGRGFASGDVVAGERPKGCCGRRRRRRR